jgi:hypothetical protein
MSRLVAFVLFLAAFRLASAEFVPNGSLFVATDNPVSATFLGGSPGLFTSLYWSTGPATTDVQESARITDGAAVGAAVSTPALASGTFVFLATLLPAPSFHDCFGCGASLITTGGGETKNPFGDTPNPFETYRAHAGVFYGANNTAFVGFTSKVDDPLTGDFASYPIRFSVSNVVGSLLGGGACK